MKNILRVLNMEFYKLKHIKILYLCLIGLLLFSIILHTTTYLSDYNNRIEWEETQKLLYGIENPKDYTAEERENIINGYKSDLESIEHYIRQAELSVNQIDIASFKEQRSKLLYLIETETLEEDYVGVGSMDYNYYGPSFFSLFFRDLQPIILVLAVFMTAVLIIYEYKSGTAKNLITAPVNRKELLLGKILFVFALIVAFTFIYLIYSLIFISFFGFAKAQTLIISTDTCYAVSVYSIFLSKFIAFFILVLTAIALTLIAGEISGSHIVAILVPFILFAFSAGGHSLFMNYSEEMYSYAYNCIIYFPFIGILEYSKGFNITYLLMSISHIILIVILIFFALKINKKREY